MSAPNEPSAGALLSIDRRTTFKWLGSAVLAASVSPASAARKVPVSIRGYGTDPDLINPVVPWPRILTVDQLRVVAALCDLLLPDDGRSAAASALGVHEFVDEWVSAPYPQQARDRRIILGALDWLAAQSARVGSRTFLQLDEGQRQQLFERLMGLRPPVADFDGGAAFPVCLRYVALGAYYTTEAGMADLGYIGNQPMAGEYPGPTREALDHLRQVLERLELSL